MGEVCKFDELRLKIDNELLKLLNDEVELGIAAAGKALTASEDPSSAVESYVKAKRAHTEVSPSALVGLRRHCCGESWSTGSAPSSF